MKNNREMLVCDLDNTLYDWVHYFVSSFYAMFYRAVDIIGCEEEELLDDFRAVHQKHHDSEHPFALLETTIVKRKFENHSHKEIWQILDPAFHAFNSTRKATLQLHEGVLETLEILKHRNILLIAHTDSKLYGVIDRLRRLELERFFKRIYCRERPDSNHPDEETARIWLETFPIHKVIELSKHQMKPNPDILLEICDREGSPPERTAYIGDSIARDILMAKRAGVFAIWAAYGSEHSQKEYNRLVRISHWTKEDVEREKDLQREAGTIRPDFTAKKAFREVVEALSIDS